MAPVALAAWTYAYMAFVCVQRHDLDFGWHFRSGQYILAHGVPTHDIFTYTARNFVWINHEWLNDVVVYATCHWLGYAAVGLVFAALWTAALVIASRGKLGWMTLGLALGALLPYVGVRPVTWTALGLAVLLWLLADGSGRLWLMVPLFGLWANLHAGFALGLGLAFLKALLDRSPRLLICSTASVAATLANPYGLGVYVELWRTMSDTHLGTRITEWAPLAINQSVAPYLVAALIMLITAKRLRFLRATGALLVIAAIWQNRQVPLLVMGTLSEVNAMISQAARFAGQRWQRVTIGTILGLVYPVVLLAWPAPVTGGVTLSVPTAAFLSLRSRPCSGHVFNDYNYGGEMINALPGVPVYIDGRMPSWVGPNGSYFSRYVSTLKGGSFTTAEFHRYDIRCALISKFDGRLASYLRRTAEWKEAVRGPDFQLWRLVRS